MALNLLSLEDVRRSARQRLEACELWLRRLIHDRLNTALGAEFVMAGEFNGQPILKREVRVRIAGRIATHPARYPRQVDAMLLDDIAAIVSKEDLYKSFFAVVFKGGFPLGREQLRLTLYRLTPIRNALSHASPISLQDAEYAFCNCNELIAAIAKFYESIGMAQDFDAPSFTKFSDSLGNVVQPSGAKESATSQGATLRPGMTLRCEVEVDAHYDPSEYDVRWDIIGVSKAEGHGVTIEISPKHVGETMWVEARIISKKDWHRFRHFDSEFAMNYRVLPPIMT